MSRKRFLLLFASLIAALLICVNCFAEDEFVQGIRTNSLYINESLGIRIDLNENFVMATDDEIRQMMAIGADVIMDSENAKSMLDISNITQVYDMLATNPAEGSTIFVMAEKPMLSGMTQNQYIDLSISQAQKVFGDIDIEQDTVEFCGNEWDIMAYSLHVSGVDMLYYSLLRKAGDRFVTLSMSGLTMESVLNMIDLISCYERY